MDVKAITSLVERIQRCQTSLSEQQGEITAWSVELSGGETCRYILKGLKSNEQFEDQLLNLAVWVWSLKDYIKHRLSTLRRFDIDVEGIANGDKNLALCADLANQAKHGVLSKSRSTLWPSLGSIRYSIPQNSLASLRFGANEVEITVGDPGLVKITCPVLDPAGKEIGDAFQVLDNAFSQLEKVLIGISAPKR